MNIEKIYKLMEEQFFHFSTDSRNIQKDDIFFALKGERFNGNDFAAQVIEQGASWVVMDEAGKLKGERCILVDDVLKTLQQLARERRKALGIPVVSIGGSNGKTTTKELVSAVLSEKFRVHVTPGNFNNHIGVPITLLRCPEDAEIMVVELGANHPGEINELCEIALPDYGLITNIGKEHLEGFGDIEGVARAESELYQHLHQNGGNIFVNMNDPWLSNMSKRFNSCIKYGHPKNDNYFVSGELLSSMPVIKAEIEGNRYESELMGAYNFDNILAAIAIGKYFDVPHFKMQHAISSYRPKNNRSQIVQTENNWILLDAYNANPSSMEAALSGFSQLDRSPKVAILGDMFELGVHSESEHRSMIQFARSLNLDRVFYAGKAFFSLSDNSENFFDSYENLENFIKTNPIKHSNILIKGSRGMALERLLNVL